MLFSDSVITPTRCAVPFGDDDFLVEAVHEDDELRPLVPRVEEMLGDINATWRFYEEADEFGEDAPEGMTRIIQRHENTASKSGRR